METDTKFYQIFQTHPEWILDMMNQPSSIKARFDSITAKRVERRLDGVWIPEDVTRPILAVEFHLYAADFQLYSVVAEKMLAVERLYPQRDVDGVIFFGHIGLDKKTSRWKPQVRTYYLDQEMARLTERSPDHPLPKLLSPIFEKSDAKLESEAKVIYAALKKSPSSSPGQAQTLCEVFYALLLSRFTNKTHQELATMLLLPDITKTRAGRELIAMGEAKGKAEGEAKGKAGTLLNILGKRLGELPKSVRSEVLHLDFLQLEKLEDQVLDLPSIKSLRAFLKSLT